MKAFLLTLILGHVLTMPSASADDYACREAALLLGDPRGPFALPEKCRQWAYENSTAEQKIFQDNGEIKSFAGPNYILTYRPEGPGAQKTYQELLIAGEETQLKNIKALSVNMRTHHLIVVDAPNSIKTFDHKNAGNIAPLYHLQGPEVEGASFAVSNEKKDQLAVAFAQEGKIKFFRLMADINGLRSDNHTKLLYTFDTAELGVSAPGHLAFDPIKEQLLVYDKGHQKVLLLDWKKNKVKSSKAVRLPASESPERIDFYDQEKTLGGLYVNDQIRPYNQNMQAGKRKAASSVSWREQYRQYLRSEKLTAVTDN